MSTSARIALGALTLCIACGDDTGRDDAGTGTAPTGVTVTATNPLPTTSGTDGSVTDGSVTASGSTDSGVSDSQTNTTGPDAPTTSASTGPVLTTDTSTGDPPDPSTGDTTGTNTTGPPVDLCKVQDDMNAIGECDDEAPANSFEPEVQWAWPGANGEIYSVVTPLVANLTDDNADGAIDLCDIPDIVVVASTSIGIPGHIYVLDGATGTLHFQIAAQVDSTVTPALGDFDGDGLPEIVSAGADSRLIAWEHDGTQKWQSASPWTSSYIAALALADLDNDGDIEIFGGIQAFDHTGVLLWTAAATPPAYSATAAADLDGDGDLEVVIGHAAVHHDGSVYYNTNLLPGFPQIANLDADPEPEVLLTNANGISLLEHTGAIKYQDKRPTGDPQGGLTWYRPATVQDFNGDDISDYAVSSGNNYTSYRADATIIWQAKVSDQSGIAAGTAFDFLGDGIAEAMYADEQFMFVFDGAGKPLLQTQRSSATGTEYPIVADVDNDGSAEIVVVSNLYGNMASPTVQVIRDKSDRWIQARRIWNQHTYHVTNVREDGTIPQNEPPSWKSLNTFRTNAQIESGGLCEPPIPQ